MARDDDKGQGLVWSVFGGHYALELQTSEEAGWGEPGEYVLTLDDGAERHPAQLTREQLAGLRNALDLELFMGDLEYAMGGTDPALIDDYLKGE